VPRGGSADRAMAKRWMGANAQCLWILTRALMEERKYGTAEWLSDCDDLGRPLG
jgi:hypothetical protein